MPDAQDPYTNPNDTPYVGSFNWVPTPSTNLGSSVPGLSFYSLTLERGQFLNYRPVTDAEPSNNLETAISGTLVSPAGSANWPVLAAFRPLQSPSVAQGTAPTDPLVITGANWKWEARLKDVPLLSAMTVDYALTVDPDDPGLPALLTEADQTELNRYLTAGTTGTLNIDWSQYNFVTVQTIDSGDTARDYPLANDTRSTPLTLTGITNQATIKRGHTIHFGTSKTTPGDYHSVKNVILKNKESLTSLRLYLYRSLFFQANRVNIDSRQLPCGVLQYGFQVSFNYRPSATTPAIVPQALDAYTPNFHVKFFHPDATTGTPGMAHSLTLRFLIFSMPAIGLAPFDFSLLGLLTDIAFPQAYYTVFIGPVTGWRTIRGVLTPTALVKAPGRSLPLDLFNVEAATTSLQLRKSLAPGDNVPDANATWVNLGPPYIPDAEAPNGFVRPYLYIDSASTKKDWYQVVQRLNNGAELVSDAFRSFLYGEKSLLGMADSDNYAATNNTENVIERVYLPEDYLLGDPLHGDPIALFTMSDNSFSSPVYFYKGKWALNLRAMCDDPDQLTTTHLFARFWFRPSDTDNKIFTEDIAPNKWQYETEFFFQTDHTGKTHLVRGTPQTLNDVLVSPPLPAVMSDLEISRYVDDLLNTGDATTWKLPFDQNGKLVVGIYAISYLTQKGQEAQLTNLSRNLPKFRLEIDASKLYLETSILQFQSHRFLPRRASRYNNSQYVALPGPLYLTRTKVGGAELTGNGTYLKYTGKFTASTNDTDNVVAFTGLTTLRPVSSTNSVNIYIPYTQVSVTKNDHSNEVYADFCTDGKILSGGRVGNGAWSFRISLNRSVDTQLIGIDYKIEAFLVTRDGKVSERIFTTPYITGVPGTGTSTISYTTGEIKYPFSITGNDTQLVVRLWVSPYSRNNQPIDINNIISLLNKQINKPPLGVRLTEFSIQTQTLSYLNINQVDSFTGSPAFYEDEPLVPNIAYGTNDFNYVADSENLKIAITFPDKDWPFSGMFYSPVWQVNMPEDMEVRVGAAGLGPTNLWIRTVPTTDGGSAGEMVLSATEDHVAKAVHVMADETTINLATPPTTNLKFRSFDFSFGDPLLAYAVKSINGTEIQIGKPNLVMLHRQSGSPSRKDGAVLLALGHHTAQGATEVTGIVNYGAGANGWSALGPNVADPVTAVTERAASGLGFSAVAASYQNSLLYIVGTVENKGVVVLKVVNLNEIPNNGANAIGPTVLIDGTLANIPAGTQIPNGFVSIGATVDTSPAIMVDPYERVLVGYVVQGETGTVFGRISQNSGYDFSAPFALTSLNDLGVGMSSDMQIYAPALTWHHYTHTAYLAFWCAGRVFVTAIPSLLHPEFNHLLSAWDLVAGDRTFTGEETGNVVLRTMESAGKLRINQSGGAEKNVPRQRVGFYASEQNYSQSKLFVYYYDTDNKLNVREIIPGVSVTASRQY